MEEAQPHCKNCFSLETQLRAWILKELWGFKENEDYHIRLPQLPTSEDFPWKPTCEVCQRISLALSPQSFISSSNSIRNFVRTVDPKKHNTAETQRKSSK